MFARVEGGVNRKNTLQQLNEWQSGVLMVTKLGKSLNNAVLEILSKCASEDVPAGVYTWYL